MIKTSWLSYQSSNWSLAGISPLVLCPAPTPGSLHFRPLPLFIARLKAQWGLQAWGNLYSIFWNEWFWEFVLDLDLLTKKDSYFGVCGALFRYVCACARYEDHPYPASVRPIAPPPIPSYLADVLQVSCEDNCLVKGFRRYRRSFAREAEQNWFKGPRNALQILGEQGFTETTGFRGYGFDSCTDSPVLWNDFKWY